MKESIPTASQKLVGAVDRARANVATARTAVQSARHESRAAKHKRKLAKGAVRDTKKRLKKVKRQLTAAKRVLAKALKEHARDGGRVAEARKTAKTRSPSKPVTSKTTKKTNGSRKRVASRQPVLVAPQPSPAAPIPPTLSHERATVAVNLPSPGPMSETSVNP